MIRQLQCEPPPYLPIHKRNYLLTRPPYSTKTARYSGAAAAEGEAEPKDWMLPPPPPPPPLLAPREVEAAALAPMAASTS